MGLRREALRAGVKPKTTPMMAEKPIAKITVDALRKKLVPIR
jgi:hypothetical protein